MDHKSKRILMFSANYLPHIGGAELALKEITDRIKDIEFDLITSRLGSDLPREERIGNVNVFRVGGKGALADFLLPKNLFPMSAFIKAVQLSRKNKYDLIFALQASQGGGAAWLFKTFNRRLQFILDIQEGQDLKNQGFLTNFFRNMIIRRADVVVVISNYLKSYVLDVNPGARVEIIPNGVNIKFIDPGEINRVRQELGISSDEKVVITISRLVEKNGVEDLVRAFVILNKNNCRLVVVGRGRPEDKGRLENKLKKLSQELGAKDKVLFVGAVSNEDINGYLGMADVFVRPSLSEGLGIAFLEAMAAGVPIIGTNVGGIPDFLKDGETGLFCKVNDPEDLAHKIDRVLNDKELSQKLIENGKKLVEKDYNWDLIADKFRTLFV